MIVNEPCNKLFNEFISTLTKDVINIYIIKYLINHTYVDSASIAKYIITEKFGMYWRNEYDPHVKAISYKLVHPLKILKDNGIVEQYNPRLYKVVRESRFGNGKVEFEAVMREFGMGREYLYFYIPVEITKQYKLIGKQRAKVNIEILN